MQIRPQDIGSLTGEKKEIYEQYKTIRDRINDYAKKMEAVDDVSGIDFSPGKGDVKVEGLKTGSGQEKISGIANYDTETNKLKVLNIEASGDESKSGHYHLSERPVCFDTGGKTQDWVEFKNNGGGFVSMTNNTTGLINISPIRLFSVEGKVS
jgi:hypothetical protein